MTNEGLGFQDPQNGMPTHHIVHCAQFYLTMRSGICGYTTGYTKNHRVIRFVTLKMPDRLFDGFLLALNKGIKL